MKTVVKSLRLPPELWARIEARAEEASVTTNAMAMTLLSVGMGSLEVSAEPGQVVTISRRPIEPAKVKTLSRRPSGPSEPMTPKSWDGSDIPAPKPYQKRKKP